MPLSRHNAERCRAERCLRVDGGPSGASEREPLGIELRASVATEQQGMLALVHEWGNDGAMANSPPANGRPEIDNTGARVKPQGMGGYRPPGRNFPIFGDYTSCEVCDPYECQEDVE